MQHHNLVADEYYKQNKQVKPQMLASTYAREEGLFPKNMKQQISDKKILNKDIIKEKKDKMTSRRIENLAKSRQVSKDNQAKRKRLSSKHRILGAQKVKFVEIVEEITSQKMIEHMKMKPTQWRHYMVRLVCTAGGRRGDELRDLWEEMYQGDLKWGVRDARFKALENDCPKKSPYIKKNDRNSWIARSLFQNLKT